MNADAQSRAISIVITNWNGRALLEKFLPSVVESAQAFENQCGQATEILVADDSSSDDSGAWLRGHWPQVRFETSGDRLGFAPTANRGVQAARFPFVYLLNNDVALEPGTLPPLVPHFQDSRVFAVAGQAFDYATGVLRGAGQMGRFRRGFLGVHDRFFVPVPRPDAKPLLTLFASGGSALFDRAKFLSLGGFDEILAPFGWEDVELSLRAWKLGFEVRYEPRSAIWHQFSSTIEPRFRRKHVASIYERNRLLAQVAFDLRVHRQLHFILILAPGGLGGARCAGGCKGCAVLCRGCAILDGAASHFLPIWPESALAGYWHHICMHIWTT